MMVGRKVEGGEKRENTRSGVYVASCEKKISRKINQGGTSSKGGDANTE